MGNPLFAFGQVSPGEMILRIRRPDLLRAFKAPGFSYLVPILGALTFGLLMYTATPPTMYRLFVWLAIGMLAYYFYGRKHSLLHQTTKA